MPKLTTKAFLRYWLPVLIWLGVIATESISALAASDQTSRIIVPLLHWLMPRLDPSQLTEIHHLLRKIGHFTGYGLLSYFFFRAWRGTHHIHAGTEQVLTRAFRQARGVLFSDYWRLSWAALAVVCTAAVASADEVHQMGNSSRTGSWWDVLLDTIGGITFQVLILVVAKFLARTPKPHSARAGA